jgi:hypothetical protein
VKKALLLAAAAGGLLISSAPPRPPVPVEEGVGYPACSRTVRDRCIQLHERGVATAENLAMNESDEPGPYAGGAPPPRIMPEGADMAGTPEMDSVVAAPGPAREIRMARNDYPPCAGGVTDRCMQEKFIAHHHARMLRIGERG